MGVPVDLGREAAQGLAREELAKQVYRDAGPGLPERALRWAVGKVVGVLDAVSGASPNGYAGVAVLVLLLVAAVVAVRLRVGPLGRRVAGEQALFTGAVRSAAEHRALAERHAAAEEWADAVRERLRAVVRALEERAVLDPGPGRTADEAAREGGAALPSCAAGLRRAAQIFDDVWYGGRPAGPEHDRVLREVDDAVRSARPGVPAPPA